jgi:hypothetical protein
MIVLLFVQIMSEFLRPKNKFFYLQLDNLTPDQDENLLEENFS